MRDDQQAWAQVVWDLVLAALVAVAFLCILRLQDTVDRLERCAQAPRHVVLRDHEFYAEGCK